MTPTDADSNLEPDEPQPSPQVEAESGEGQEPEEEARKLTLEVSVDKPGTCQRHVTITIPREDIEHYLKKAIDELAPKAEVPGFRPGRAPKELVRRHFRDRVKDQVKGSLLMDSLEQVSEEQNFSAISEPDFDFDAVELPDDGPMVFEFDLEVRPDFELPAWKGLKLTRPTREFREQDVETQLRRVLSRYAELVPTDEPAELGDYLTLDVSFKKDDRVLSHLDEETVRVQPKLSFRDAELENFGQLMQGAKAGDRKTATLKVSQMAANEALQGAEVEVDFEVLEVKKEELPQVTPAVLERLGGFESEDEVREAIRGELERQLAYHRDRKIREQITALLTESADWDLPPALLRRQSRRELERAVMELQAAGFSNDDIRAHANRLRQNSEASTATALKEHFILERIAEEEDLEAEPEDYDKEIMLIAMQGNEPPRRVRARLEKRNQMDTLRNQIIERKAIKLITDHAEFTDTPFELQPQDTVAVDHAVAGEPESEIPEALHAEAQPGPRLPGERE